MLNFIRNLARRLPVSRKTFFKKCTKISFVLSNKICGLKEIITELKQSVSTCKSVQTRHINLNKSQHSEFLNEMSKIEFDLSQHKEKSQANYYHATKSLAELSKKIHLLSARIEKFSGFYNLIDAKKSELQLIAENAISANKDIEDKIDKLTKDHQMALSIQVQAAVHEFRDMHARAEENKLNLCEPFKGK